MKKYTKALILIGVTLGILTAVFYVSYNHADGKASAEVSTIVANTQYSPVETAYFLANFPHSGTHDFNGTYQFADDITVYDKYGVNFTSRYINVTVTLSGSYWYLQYNIYNSSSESTATKYMRFSVNKSTTNYTYIYYGERANTSSSYTSTSIWSSQTNIYNNDNNYRIAFGSTTIINADSKSPKIMLDLAKFLSVYVPPITSKTLENGFYFADWDTSTLNQGDYLNLEFTCYYLADGTWDNQKTFTTISIGNPFGPTTTNDKRIYFYDARDETNYLIVSDTYGNINTSFYLLLEEEQTVPINGISEGLYKAPRAAVQAMLHAYSLGFTDGANYNILTQGTGGVIGAIFSGLFGQIFAVEIIPGFPLYIFILIPVVFTILSLVLWLMRGR